MRRKPYSELLAGASAGSLRPAPATEIPVPARAPETSSRGQAGTTSLSSEAAQRCRAEIRLLAAMIDRHHSSTDTEGKKMCLFTHEKLAKASAALARNDGDEAWVHLYGAAMMCRTFQIQPDDAERTIARLNSMLG